MRETTLESLAKAIANEFDALNGRAFAVSEVDPFDDQSNRPTLPVAVVALANGEGEQSQNGSSEIKLTDTVLVHFLYEPEKYAKNDRDLPFFKFYDYEGVRDQLLAMLQGYVTPRGSVLAYRAIAVTSDEFAVYITFTFSVLERWCPPAVEAPEVFDAQKSVKTRLGWGG